MFMKLLISGAVAAVCEPSLGEGRSPYTEGVWVSPGPIQFVSTLSDGAEASDELRQRLEARESLLSPDPTECPSDRWRSSEGHRAPA
jgi:hypothetical protein